MTDEYDQSESSAEEIGEGEDPREQLVCPHCIAPIESGEHLCHKCGGPITAHAMYDPLGHIWAMGYGYRNLTGEGRRPSKLALIGIWLIFGSGVVYCISWLMASLSDLLKSFDGKLIFFVLVDGLMLTIQLMILDRVTRNYCSARRRCLSEPPQEDDDAEELDQPILDSQDL